MFKIVTSEEGFSIFLHNQLRVKHIEHNLPLMFLGTGQANYSEHLGAFTIKETEKSQHAVSNYKLLSQTDSEIRVQYSLLSDMIIVNFRFDNDQLTITFENVPEKYNRFWINLPASAKEGIYGGGEQYSEFNLAHQTVPLWVQEQGIGRKGFVSLLANLMEGAGGSKFHTYYPQPTFVSLENYFCHVEQSAYGELAFHTSKTPQNHHQLHFWQVPESITIGVKPTFQETVAAVNKFLGLQPKLPEWAYSGMWLAIQGEDGIEGVKSRLKLAMDAGVQISAIWSQDWQGILKTSFGTQLFWDWKWDGPNREIRFPNFPDFVKEIREHGIRYLGYINPFLYTQGVLFQEAQKNGFLVRTLEGNTFITRTTTFDVGLLDLTNPDACEWIKSVIKTNMIEEAGLSGWMCDFGEYLPICAQLASQENPELVHNKYPVLWDRVNLEAITEMGKADEIVFFTRSGYSHSSKYTPMVWAGDQNVNWGYHDGLASVIPAALSLSMCGIGYHCSDIGGFTSLKWIKRSKELFIRWVEQACFTMLMRTHEGNRPEVCWQFDSDQETLDHLARMTKIHVALKEYLQFLSEEYQNTGIAPLRPLVLHYPEDPLTHNMQYQYLLGKDLLVSPVLKRKKKAWKVYIPQGEWLHLWSDDSYSQGFHKIQAPWGFPPVFYQKGSVFEEVFEAIQEKYGLYT